MLKRLDAFCFDPSDFAMLRCLLSVVHRRGLQVLT